MVLALLYMKAELENVATVSLRKENVHLCISVRNPLSDYEVRERVVLDPSTTIQQDDNNSREPPHHFRLTWEGSQKASILTVLSVEEAKSAMKKIKKNKGSSSAPQVPDGSYEADDSGLWIPILAVECRGLEPYQFYPMGDEFIITSSGGTIFTGKDIDFSETDWADYDADHDMSVSLSQIQFKWESI